MCGLSLGVQAHVSADSVIRHRVFPEYEAGPFVSVKVEAANSNTGVSLLITDPDVLATIAATVSAAQQALINAKTAHPSAGPVPTA